MRTKNDICLTVGYAVKKDNSFFAQADRLNSNMLKTICVLTLFFVIFFINTPMWSFAFTKAPYKQENITDKQYQATLNFALQNYNNKFILPKKETKKLLDKHFNASYLYIELDCINWDPDIEGITYPFLSIISVRKDVSERNYGFILAHEICHYINCDNNEASTSYNAITSLLISNDEVLQNIAYFGIIYISNFDNEYNCIPNVYSYLTQNGYL